MLDEADRLLDLGFEAKLKAIIEKFDSRSSDSNPEAAAAGAGGPGSNTRRRQTVLLSATLHPGLSVLAGLSLQDPVGVGFKAKVVDGQLQLAAEGGADGGKPQEQQQVGQQGVVAAAAGGQIAFELPQQLRQKFVDVDAKMRLVYLIGEAWTACVQGPCLLLFARHWVRWVVCMVVCEVACKAGSRSSTKCRCLCPYAPVLLCWCVCVCVFVCVFVSPVLTGVLQGRLRRSKASKMVVFFSNCDSVEFHHELFRRDLQLSHSHSHSQAGVAEPVKLLGSVPVLKLHGDMLQPERTSSLVTFAKVCMHTSTAAACS